MVTSSLWRIHLTTRLAVLFIVVSLMLIGAALLLWQVPINASEALKSDNGVTVWMKSDASAHEIHTVGTQLARLSYLRRPCTYWSKTRNFAEARKLLPSAIWHKATIDDMPTSYWCTPAALADANRVIGTMRGVRGVLTVTINPANLYRD
jgi:cell division protein FtsX